MTAESWREALHEALNVSTPQPKPTEIRLAGIQEPADSDPLAHALHRALTGATTAEKLNRQGLGGLAVALNSPQLEAQARRALGATD